MAKVLVKKFTLVRDGARYTAGCIAEIPEDEAAGLAAASPQEFELIDVPAGPVAAKTAEEPAESVCLEKLSVAQLKEYAAGNGIDIGGAARKQDIIDAIVTAAEAGKDGLPPVDPEATVK